MNHLIQATLIYLNTKIKASNQLCDYIRILILLSLHLLLLHIYIENKYNLKVFKINLKPNDSLLFILIGRL